jgi:hypothetical protein
MNEAQSIRMATSRPGLASVGAGGGLAAGHGADPRVVARRPRTEPRRDHVRGSSADVPAYRPPTSKGQRVSWLRHGHLFVLLGVSGVAAVVQWVGFFHV